MNKKPTKKLVLRAATLKDLTTTTGGLDGTGTNWVSGKNPCTNYCPSYSCPKSLCI